jgi:proteic killer suppression protein
VRDPTRAKRVFGLFLLIMGALTNITFKVILRWSMITLVEISKKAEKDILKLPNFIQRKLRLWIYDIERLGLDEVQKVRGYHDEQLKGDRKGQRSIRLNDAYRAIYTIRENGTIEFAYIEEVNKHDY